MFSDVSYFGVLHPVARTLSRLLVEPLHISALAGHLQEEYTIFSGSYVTHYGSGVLCYRSYFVYVLANTAVVYLICDCEVSRFGSNHLVVKLNLKMLRY
jgi:hypothetical protein